MAKPILILKFGSASLAHANGGLNKRVMLEIARQTSLLCSDYRVAIVSSGAVAAGKAAMKGFTGSITERKAAAAVGNPLLLQQYSQFFAAYDIPVAQSLCERRHFADRRQFLQLTDTFECLWQNGIVPIVNENDVVSDRELRFSDNDELATLLAVGFGADEILFCTSAGGLLNENGEIIRKVKLIDDEVFAVVRNEKSALGLGGMAAKLTFAKLATRFGIRAHIFGMDEPNAIIRTLNAEIGTEFMPQKSSESARQRWLASGGLASGKVAVDHGAEEALRRRNSLLAVGVQNVKGNFNAGELVEIVNEKGNIIAIAKMNIGAEILNEKIGSQGIEVAHADEIVMLEN